MTTFIGIDPGTKGAIACLSMDGTAILVEDLEGRDESLLCSTIGRIYKGSVVTYTVIERVQGIPAWGAPSAFAFGQTVGSIRGILAALSYFGIGSPWDTVLPKEWQKSIGVPHPRVEKVPGEGAGRAIRLREAKKQHEKDLLAWARRRFPNMADRLARAKDIDRAAALAIAEYGRRMWIHGNAVNG